MTFGDKLALHGDRDEDPIQHEVSAHDVLRAALGDAKSD